jgi:hypothetical protein
MTKAADSRQTETARTLPRGAALTRDHAPGRAIVPMSGRVYDLPTWPGLGSSVGISSVTHPYSKHSM